MKLFGLTVTKLFHLHRIFRRGFHANPEPPLYLPLLLLCGTFDRPLDKGA